MGCVPSSLSFAPPAYAVAVPNHGNPPLEVDSVPELAVELIGYETETRRVMASLAFGIIGDEFRVFTKMAFALEVHSLIMKQHEASIFEMENLKRQMQFLSSLPHAPTSTHDEIEAVENAVSVTETVLSEMEEKKNEMLIELDEKAAQIAFVVQTLSRNLTPFYAAQLTTFKERLTMRRGSTFTEEQRLDLM